MQMKTTRTTLQILYNLVHTTPALAIVAAAQTTELTTALCGSGYIELFCFFSVSNQHKDSSCVHRSVIYPQRHSCDMWAHSVPDQTGTETEIEDGTTVRMRRLKLWKIQLTTTWIVCCWEGKQTKISECISKGKKRERTKNQVKPKRLADFSGIWWHATATKMHQW